MIRRWLANRRLNKRLDEICSQSLRRRVENRSKASQQAARTSQRYDRTKDKLWREVNNG